MHYTRGCSLRSGCVKHHFALIIVRTRSDTPWRLLRCGVCFNQRNYFLDISNSLKARYVRCSPLRSGTWTDTICLLDLKPPGPQSFRPASKRRWRSAANSSATGMEAELFTISYTVRVVGAPRKPRRVRALEGPSLRASLVPETRRAGSCPVTWTENFLARSSFLIEKNEGGEKRKEKKRLKN